MKIQKIISVILCAALLLSVSGCSAISSAVDYRKAVSLTEKGELEQAYELFTQLGDYKDSSDRLTKCGYSLAKTAMDEEEYEKAAEYLESLEGYKNSDKLLRQCKYHIASETMENGDYDSALELFAELDDYEDSQEMLVECRYLKALDLFERKEYEEARAEFITLGQYKDCVHYDIACGLLEDPDKFIDMFIYGLNLRLSMEDVPFRFEESDPYYGDCRTFTAVSDDKNLLKNFNLFIEFRHMGPTAASYTSKIINDIHLCSEMEKYNKDTYSRMYGSAMVAAAFINCQLISDNDYGSMLGEVSGLFDGGLDNDGPRMDNITSGSADFMGFGLSFSMLTSKTVSSINYDIFVPEMMNMR